jgi:hypothetical protein
MHHHAPLLALLASGCLTRADGMVFVETQQVPAASGLAGHAQFQVYGGQYLPPSTLLEEDGLWTWQGYDDSAPEEAWLEGDQQPEVQGYLEIEGFMDSPVTVASVVSDHAGLEKFTLDWGSSLSQESTAVGRVEFVDPAGLGPHLLPWFGWDAYLVIDGLVLLPGVQGIGSLQILSEDSVPLVGDGMATVIQQGSGLELAEGERIPVMAGRLPIDPSLGDGVTPGVVALEDGRELELPLLRVLDSTDRIDDSWSLALQEGAGLLSLHLLDSEGHVALVPEATSGWFGPEDNGGAVLVAVDGLANDGSLGCRAQFLFHPDADQQRIEVCVGGACESDFYRGLIDRYDGEEEGCPW